MTNQLHSEQPLVSVIVPAYNAEKFIAATLHSVLTQTYRSIEVIVVDDGSTDRTAEIVQEFAALDRRVILLQQKNARVCAARNSGIQAAKGQFISPIDADDIWYPQKLEKQMQVMLQSDESVGLVYSWSVCINEDGSLTPVCNVSNIEGDVYIPLLYDNFLGNGSSILVRRACLEKVGAYNTEMDARDAGFCEDWEFYLRIAEHYQFRVAPELLIGYRQVAGSTSLNCEKMKRSFELVATTAQQKHPEIPDKVFRWGKSRFNCYLAMKYKQIDDDWKTAVHLLQAAQLDYLPLLRPGFYVSFVKSLVQILQKSISSTPKLEDRSQSEIHQPLAQTSLTLDELNQIETSKSQRFPRRQYNDLLQRRWRSIQSEIKRQEFKQKPR